MVAAYLSEQGGSLSRSLCHEVCRVLSWCEESSFPLMGEFLPDTDNVLADVLSGGGPQTTVQLRLRGSSVEGHLLLSICRSIFARLVLLHLGLFVSRLNPQLPNCYFWEAVLEVMGTNAMVQDWSGLMAYAFPPITMLVAPLWPETSLVRPPPGALSG